MNLTPLTVKLASLVLVITLLLAGCGQTAPEPKPESPAVAQVSPEPRAPPPTTVASAVTAPVTQESGTTAPSTSRSIIERLDISKPPRVGETVDLTFTLDVVAELKPVTKVWLEFERYDPAVLYPLGRGTGRHQWLSILSTQTAADSVYSYLKRAANSQPVSLVPAESVVLAGNTTWQGPPLKEGDRIRFAPRIRFPEEGEWWIAARWQVEGEPSRVCSELYLTVGKDSGVIGWEQSKSPGNVRYAPAFPETPLGFYVRTDRVPLVGEPMTLWVSVESLRDVDAADASLVFRRADGFRQVEVPHGELIVAGTGAWKGPLKKGVPAEFSCVVKFPVEGDWRIAFLAVDYLPAARERYNMYFHVGKEKSRFGWPEERREYSP